MIRTYNPIYKSDVSKFQLLEKAAMLPETENIDIGIQPLYDKPFRVYFVENDFNIRDFVDDNYYVMFLIGDLINLKWELKFLSPEDENGTIPAYFYLAMPVKLKKEKFNFLTKDIIPGSNITYEELIVKQKMFIDLFKINPAMPEFNQNVIEVSNIYYASGKEFYRSLSVLGVQNELYGHISDCFIGDFNQIKGYQPYHNYCCGHNNRLFYEKLEGIFNKRNSIYSYMPSNNFVIAWEDNYINIEGKYNELVVFDKNNIIDNPSFDRNLQIYRVQKQSDFGKQVLITEKTFAGDDYIIVDDPTYFLKGNIIAIMTKHNGFIYREVVGVIDNKIFLDEPLGENEETFVGGFVKCRVPVELDEINTEIAVTASAYRRKFYVKDSLQENLYLRKVLIGDFLSKIVYFDSNTNAMLINDIKEDETPAGTPVKILSYKFKDSVTFTYGDKLPNVFVEQKVYIDGNEYTIKGFSSKDNSLILDKDIDLTGRTITTEAVSEDLIRKSTRKKLISYKHFKKYNNFFVTNEDIQEGDLLSIDNVQYEVKKVVKKNNYNIVFLDIETIPLIISDYLVNEKYCGQYSEKTDKIIELKNKVQGIEL